jgi:hypothetical protein
MSPEEALRAWKENILAARELNGEHLRRAEQRLQQSPAQERLDLGLRREQKRENKLGLSL